MYTRLTEMLRKGEGRSKRRDKKNKNDRDKIYSFSTYQNYWKQCKKFALYVMENHPEVTTLKAARKYVREYMQYRIDKGGPRGRPLSAFSITLDRQALNKLYGITPDDKDFFITPRRRRVDIKRSRVPVAADKYFNENNNRELVNFCRATGCRRNVLSKLKGSDLFHSNDMRIELARLKNKDNLAPEEEKRIKELGEALDTFPEQDYFLYHHRDKGGKNRFSPIIGKYKNDVINRINETAPEEKVWKAVPLYADIHSYRADYANDIYRMFARPIEAIPFDKRNKGSKKWYQSGVYCCRSDEKGKRYDREAMLKASRALGHNRVEVVASSYLRGI